MIYSGEYGGKVIREFKGDGMKFIAGAILKPEDVMHWPLANRMSFHTAGKVEWYGPPVEAEQVARLAGKPAPSHRAAVTPPKPVKTSPVAPKAGSRRTRS